MKTVDKMNDSDVKEVPTVQGEVTNEAEVLAATVVPPSEVIVSSSEKFTESASEGVSKDVSLLLSDSPSLLSLLRTVTGLLLRA